MSDLKHQRDRQRENWQLLCTSDCYYLIMILYNSRKKYCSINLIQSIIKGSRRFHEILPFINTLIVNIINYYN